MTADSFACISRPVLYPNPGSLQMFCYTVRCTFESPQVAEEWLDWLRRGHLAEVCAAGARDAEVVRIDGPAIILEARYHFDNRAAFERYEHEHAPRLRADGLKQFPAQRGVKYERSTGEVVAVSRA
jgi:hypothetical protein